MKAAIGYREDLIEDLKDTREASAYLNAALAEGDKQAFLLALRNVLEAHGMTEMARKSGLNRVSLYKMLSENGNPGFENILSLLKALGIEFRIVGKTSSRSKRAA